MKTILTTLLSLWIASAAHAESFLPTGSLLHVTITNAIFSFNLATPVLAELDEAARFKENEVLPKGTRIIGKALVLKSHDRVNVDFTVAVLPDGREIRLSAIALSPDGSAGIRGKVEKYQDSAVASAALKGAIQGSATLMGQAANPIAGQIGQATADETVREIDLSSQNIDTSISVPGFNKCLVYLNHRLEIAPIRKETKHGNHD